MLKAEMLSKLEAMKQLLSYGWIQHRLATDDDGITIDPYNVRATCFCLLGAAVRVSSDAPQQYAEITDVLERHLPASAKQSLPAFNDSPFTKHGDVMGLINDAINEVRKWPDDEDNKKAT